MYQVGPELLEYEHISAPVHATLAFLYARLFSPVLFLNTD